MRATAKDLRFHTKKLLDTVSRGEEIIITYRGTPCAKLVPMGEEAIEKKSKNDLFGIWADNDATADIEHYVRNLRKGRY